jgi:hypothetical protein
MATNKRKPGDGAKPYEDLSYHASDNEFLYYINHKLAYTNSLLQSIKTALYLILGLLVGLAIMYWRS